MVSNPMQRKSRNAFLLGVIITLFITGVIIVLLFFMLKQKDEEIKTIESSKKSVYVLGQDVKAGQILTQDMFELKKVPENLIPENATATMEKIDAWFLQTKSGEAIYTDEYGLYLDKPNGDADTIIEVLKNEGKEFEDSKGNTVAVGDFYVDVSGITEKVNSINSVTQDENETGMFIVDEQELDKITRVYQENATGQFYIYKIDSTTLNTSATKTRVKEYIELNSVPVLAKVEMNKNTVITPQLVVQSDQTVTDDTREEEYNMIELPIELMTEDYVDIRLMTPSGQNFIVISKVQVNIPMNLDGTYVADTIRVNLREDEILAMSSAIVEAYGIEGAKLYVTKYVDPVMQKAATPTYTPNASVTAQIDSNGDGKIDNPNIVENAKQELAKRYTEEAKKTRNDYLNQIINATEGYYDNITSGMDNEVVNSQEARQDYLESLQ